MPIVVLLVTVVIILMIVSAVLFDPCQFPESIINELTGPDDKSGRWYRIKKSRKIKGVALIIHGLNLMPERMEPVIFVLNRAGIDVLNLSLRGHGGNYDSISHMDKDEQRLESFRTVTYALWSKEVLEAYQKVKQRAAREKAPIFFVGYSMGALLGCNLLSAHPDVHFDRMALFAPALNVTLESYMLKVLSPFPSLVIDSLSPKEYRSNDGTPMAAYTALFEAIAHFRKNVNQQINVPTIIFMDEKDELISYAQLVNMIENNGLDRWKTHVVKKDDDINVDTSRHLIISEKTIGKNMWGKIEILMTRHLLH